ASTGGRRADYAEARASVNHYAGLCGALRERIGWAGLDDPRGAGPGGQRTINVLVVDDSAVGRPGVGGIPARTPGTAVSAAADPIIARDKMKRTRPDVILLDIHMPRMDGLTFLRQIMSEDPVPVVVCSSLTGTGTDVAMRALEEGAVDIVTKPKV